MKIIIPMAGHGARFLKAGYVDPKPLINVDGKRIIEYIIDMFDRDDEFVFICDNDHLGSTNMRSILSSLQIDNFKIIGIEPHSNGPVHTIMQVENEIDDEEEVIICYCDNPYLWNYSDFKSHIKNTDSDGCVLTHVGFHPHRLSSTYMAYLKVENGIMKEIQEKKPYTENPMEEHASTGTYYFRKWKYVKKYSKQLIDRNINYNGEFYVTLLYNLLNSDGLKTTIYNTDITMVFGTPEEVDNFQAWMKILRSTQVKSPEDAARCCQYWLKYLGR